MSEMHPRLEEIQELLDGRLQGEARRSIEAHLEPCATCRARYERMMETRRILRMTVSETEEVPEALRARIVSTLDKERAPRRHGWRLAAGLAAAAALAIVFILRVRQPAGDLPAAAIRDFETVSAGKSPLELQTSDAAQLQTWFDRQLGFSSRVFDLGMMGYHLAGGRIDEVADKPSALFVYRREDGALVICEMFQAVTSELPADAERRHHNGIEFFIFERDGTTTVFWQEGSVVCVLASRINREELIALAYAKAMQPA